MIIHSLCMEQFIYLHVCLSFYLSTYLHVYTLFINLSIHLSVYLSIDLFHVSLCILMFLSVSLLCLSDSILLPSLSSSESFCLLFIRTFTPLSFPPSLLFSLPSSLSPYLLYPSFFSVSFPLYFASLSFSLSLSLSFLLSFSLSTSLSTYLPLFHSFTHSHSHSLS